jgi:hypothetical protein
MFPAIVSTVENETTASQPVAGFGRDDGDGEGDCVADTVADVRSCDGQVTERIMLLSTTAKEFVPPKNAMLVIPEKAANEHAPFAKPAAAEPQSVEIRMILGSYTRRRVLSATKIRPLLESIARLRGAQSRETTTGPST